MIIFVPTLTANKCQDVYIIYILPWIYAPNLAFRMTDTHACRGLLPTYSTSQHVSHHSFTHFEMRDMLNIGICVFHLYQWHSDKHHPCLVLKGRLLFILFGISISYNMTGMFAQNLVFCFERMKESVCDIHHFLLQSLVVMSWYCHHHSPWLH